MADGDKSSSGIEKAMRELEAREAAIAKREKEVAEKEAAVVAAEDSSKTRPLRATENVYKGEFPYMFEVRSVNNNPDVPTKHIECCDESEAKRWYQVTTPHPKNVTKQIDLVTFPVNVVCLSPERSERLGKAKRLAGIAKRLEAGFALSKEDQALLAEAETT
jgi:hypothetical protein